MALSVDFCTPSPDFDPTKYGRKSATRTANVVKTMSTPDAEVPAQKSESPAPFSDVFPSTVKVASKETTTSVLEASCPIKTKDTTSTTKVTTAKTDKPAATPKVEIEQPASSQALKQGWIESRSDEIIDISLREVELEEPPSVPGSEKELINSGTEDNQSYPVTLITAENFDLASIPAPDEADSTDTRRLVSLRRVRNIRQAKIDNRWITLAQVDEWTCTVPRHAFREGQLVIYVEIDAFLPSADRRFGTIASLQTYSGVLGHRVKTRRFGSYPDKLVVQGYIYPLEKFDEIFREIECIRQVLDNIPYDKPSQKMTKEIICAMYRNQDWAADIGVKKWEEPNPANKPNKHSRLGAVPTRVFKKTDITHFEDCPNLFTKAQYYSREYQESVKMDGASMTVYFVKKTARKYHDLNELPEEVGPNMVLNNGRFGVTSKTVDMNELSTCVFGYWKTALKNDLPAKLSNLDRSIAIQGEICGPGINQNREKLEETQFFVYSMWDIAAQKYIDPRRVEALAKNLGLKHVPVLGYVKIRDIASNHGELRDLADKRPSEGLVYKCVHDGRSFKVHSPAYKVLHNC